MNATMPEMEGIDFAWAMDMAHELIDLAIMVGPEGEGLDLTDRGFDVNSIVHLKSVLGNMYSAIQRINKALAQAWEASEDTKAKIVMGEYVYGLGYDTRRDWVHGDNGVAFAKWLKEQDPETIAAILPGGGRGLRVTSMGAARNTFLEESRSSDTVKITSRKVT